MNFTGIIIAIFTFLISSLCAILAASSLWSIRELFEQEKRVKKGWFPKK